MTELSEKNILETKALAMLTGKIMGQNWRQNSRTICFAHSSKKFKSHEAETVGAILASNGAFVGDNTAIICKLEKCCP